jgi:integrase
MLALREGSPLSPAAPGPRTVSHLLSSYTTHVVPHRTPRTQYQLRCLFTHWHHTLGGLPLSTLTPAVFHRWRDGLLRQGLAPRTVHQRMAELQRVLTWATTQGWLESNPLRVVAKPTPPVTPPRLLTPAEHQRLLDACRASTHPHLHGMVLLSLHAGLQKAQVQHLLWDEVTLDGPHPALQVTRHDQRTQCSLSGELLAVLQQKFRTRDPAVPWVFPRRDGQPPSTFQRAWHTARVTAGLPGYRFDALRAAAPARVLRLLLWGTLLWHWGDAVLAWGMEMSADVLGVLATMSGL